MKYKLKRIIESYLIIERLRMLRMRVRKKSLITDICQLQRFFLMNFYAYDYIVSTAQRQQTAERATRAKLCG